MTLVSMEVRDRVSLVTLDDPGRRNALSLAMAEELGQILGDLANDRNVGAVVITGRGTAFSAGADLADLENADRDSLRRIYDGFLAVSRFPLPTIAAVNGPAVGAGLNMALACDIRIAGHGARFESRFTDLALHPGGGHTWMLHRLLGPQGATAMALCNESLDGEQAVRRGMAWSCVPDESLLETALSLAGRAASTPRELALKLKENLRAMAAITDHGEAVDRELQTQLWSTRQPEFKKRLAALKRKISR